MPVTRINNNQITDAASGNVYVGVNAAAKVQDYSITAGKIANNLTYGSDLTIAGNLTVQGNTTTIDTVNLVVEDPLILLAKEQTGSPTLDIGFIGKRGTSDNIAFVWDENQNQFVTVFTSSETTNTTITINSYASLKTLDMNVTGNLDVTGNITFTGNVASLNVTGNLASGNLLTPGVTSAGGNVTGANFITSGLITATGNITSANVNTGNVSATGNVAAVGFTGGNASITGNVYAQNFVGGNIFGNIDAGGSNTNVQFNDGDILAGSNNFTFDKSTNTMTVTGNIIGTDVSATGNIITNNVSVPSGNLSFASANLTSLTNVLAGGVVSATGNITGGNVLTGGLVSATGNVTGGNLITSGLATITGTVTAGNVATAGTVSATGNVTGGNVLTGGFVSATGNVTAGNVNTAIVSASGNVIGANLLTSGEMSATGNVYGNNVIATDGIFGNVDVSGDITVNSLTSNTFVSATGNVVSANVYTTGVVSATGTITGGNLATGGTASATGNITGGNLLTGGLASVGGNITGANLITGGIITATGTATVGNLATGGTVSATGNITSGGIISAVGNIAGNNISAAGFVSASGNVEAPTVVTSTITTNSGDLVLDSAGGALQWDGTGNIVMNGQWINNLSDPVQAQDAATKEYVDNAVSTGITIHQPVYVEAPTALPAVTYAQGGNTATVTDTIAGNTVVFSSAINPQKNDQLWFTSSFSGIVANVAYFVVSAPNTSAAVLSTAYNGTPVSNISNATGLTQAVRINSGQGATLTANSPGQLTVDGINPPANARVLVYNQAISYENGVYVLTQTGNISAPFILTRASSEDTYAPDDINGLDAGDYFYVQYGNTGAGESYVMTAPIGPFIIGYDGLTFTQFSASQVYSANTAAGLVLNGTEFSAKVDNDTTSFDGNGNISVKAGANLVTPNIGAATGTSLSLSGNVVSANVNTGIMSASGNVTGSNLFTAGVVSATGNVTGGNLITSGLATVTGTVTAGNVDTSGTVSATGNVTGGNLITSGLATVTGTVQAGNLFTTGAVSATGNATAGNVLTGGEVSATGNVTGGNVLTGGIVSAAGNIDSSSNISATGNVTGGNLITSGLATVTGTVTAGNVATAGTVSATGNVTGGNVLTGGFVLATGNVDSANINTGNVSATGNIAAVNFTGTSVSVTGNVTAANFIGNISGNIDAAGSNTWVQFNDTGDILGASANFTFDKATNIMTVNGTIEGTTVSATGNVIGGNVTTGGLVSATGDVTGGNLVTAGLATVTGNVIAGNVTTAGLVSATGNVTGGNVLTSGLVSATGNVTGGNLETTGLATVTGNITGGNLLSAGLASIGGNITGANLILTSGIIDGAASGRIDINGSGLDTDFAVSGDTTANILYIDAGTGTASFGSSAQTTNAIVAFNATNSILMPVGNTQQRPGTGVVGMLRFNSTGDSLEVYTSGGWEDVGVPAFTVITADSFAGNGTATQFTLSQDSTTAATIVSINGIVQIPTTAYAVSGNVLTFTEAPAPDDKIDARLLTTTTTVTAIDNISGNAMVQVLDTADTVQITGNLLPAANVTYNLGSPTAAWNNAYFNGTTIFLGNLQLKQVDASTFGVFKADGTTAANVDVGSIDVSSITQGTSEIGISGVNGNAYITVGGQSNTLVVGQSLSTLTGSFSVTGNVIAQDVNSLSDATLKTNINPLTGVTEVIQNLTGVQYDWKNGTGHSYGFLAQEVERVLPDAVKTGPDGLKAINYQMIIPFLVETIKQMGAEIQDLKRTVSKRRGKK